MTHKNGNISAVGLAQILGIAAQNGTNSGVFCAAIPGFCTIRGSANFTDLTRAAGRSIYVVQGVKKRTNQSQVSSQVKTSDCSCSIAGPEERNILVGGSLLSNSEK